MAFVPLLAAQNKLAAERTIKYFFIQASASALIFYFSLHNFYYSGRGVVIGTSTLPLLGIALALLLKLGAAPLHFWFPAIIEGLAWLPSALLLTWQKIAPLILLWLVRPGMAPVLVSCATISAIVGAAGGMSQLLVRKLIAYSSISHIGWMLYSILLSKLTLIVYFLIYRLLTLTIIIIFTTTKTFFLTQLFTHQGPLTLSSRILSLNFLSLGGLPPFLGFLPKWLALKQGITPIILIIALILVICSVVALYYYLRFSYSALIIVFKTPSIISAQLHSPSSINLLCLFRVTGLPLAIMICTN